MRHLQSNSKISVARESFFLCFFVASLGLFTTSTSAQILDMKLMADRTYLGKEPRFNKSACRMSLGPIRRDFSGRFYQDFRFEVNNNPKANYEARLRQNRRLRTPVLYLGKNRLKYTIAFDDHTLELITLSKDPLQVLEFNLTYERGVYDKKWNRIECKIASE